MHSQVVVRKDLELRGVIEEIVKDLSTQLRVRLLALKEDQDQGVDPFRLNEENLTRINPFTLHLPSRKQFTV